MKANLFLEPSAKLEEANSRYDTSSSTDGYGTSRVNDQVSRSAQHHTASEGCIQDNLHVELFKEDSANGIGCDAGACKGKNGVYDDSLLLGGSGECSVEGWP